MKKVRNMLVAVALLTAVVFLPFNSEAVQKQKQKKAPVSPHETVSADVGDAKVSITYGRPYTKDPKSGASRSIFGNPKVVPWGKAWRAGADEATTLDTNKDLVVGGTAVPAGKYTLYLLPMEKGGSKMAISKTTGQWGIPVKTDNDLARVDVKQDTLPKAVEQFTIAIDKTGDGGVIKMSWETTEFSVPFSVKK